MTVINVTVTGPAAVIANITGSAISATVNTGRLITGPTGPIGPTGTLYAVQTAVDGGSATTSADSVMDGGSATSV